MSIDYIHCDFLLDTVVPNHYIFIYSLRTIEFGISEKLWIVLNLNDKNNEKHVALLHCAHDPDDQCGSILAIT